MKKAAMITVLACMIPISALATTVNVKDKFSDEQIVQILKDEGYSSVKKRSDGLLVIKIDGTAYIIRNYKDGDLVATYIASGVDVSYKDMNEWNSKKRLSRAYLDSDRDPHLEADMLSNGGVSEKNVSEFFRIFTKSAKAFKSFLLSHDKS